MQNLIIALTKTTAGTITKGNATYGRRLATTLEAQAKLLRDAFGQAETPAQRTARHRQAKIAKGETYLRVSPHGLEMLRAMMSDPSILTKGFSVVEKEYRIKHPTVGAVAAVNLIRAARGQEPTVTVDLNGAIHIVTRSENATAA